MANRAQAAPSQIAQVVLQAKLIKANTVKPQLPSLVHDLPTGAPRLLQKADGIMATIVNGEILIKDNQHTGALPGRLIRGPLAHH